MATQLTKKGILEWHVRAIRSLEMRKHGKRKNPIAPFLSEKDYLAYKRSIERHFTHLKQAFNRELELRKKREIEESVYLP